MERIICFALGFSLEDIEKGKASFEGAAAGKKALNVVPVTKDMMALPVIDVLAGLIMGSDASDDEKRGQPVATELPVCAPYRVMVVNTTEREEVVQIMRCFKAALSDPGNLIFAVLTETALSWTFQEYVGHLTQEHECMLARDSGNK